MVATERYILEGRWSGYVASQMRVVHRDVVSKKVADAAKAISPITYTDGTVLYLSARRAQPRERVTRVLGYRSLIEQCIRHGVSAVVDLPNEVTPS